jgi:hypothetical protein
MVPATLLAAFIYNRPVSLVSIIALSFSYNDLDLAAEALCRHYHRQTTGFTTLAFDHVLPSCDGGSALNVQARVIAEHLLRNPAIKRKLHLLGNFNPDSERLSGLLADLQEARATTIYLIKCK